MKRLILISAILFSSFSFSQENDEEKSKKPFKVYASAEEHEKALQEYYIKRMKKIGRSKMIDFSKQLLKKEDDIRDRELALEKKELELKSNMKTFSDKIKTFQGRQTKFLACLDDNDNQSDKRVKHMVEVVSGMKPAVAAEVLSVQDPLISVKIMSKLESVKVSKIFNLMDKEISARLQKQYMTMKK